MANKPENPVNPYLRLDRMPSIWCPGCGIGTSVNCFARAITQSKVDLQKLSIVSGIGCTGRVSGYLNFDSFHTTHGRPIPFATGLKLANPDLHVVVYSGEGDLIAIGGNHFIHAARRNVDILVVCVNNFVYGMTGGQVSPTSPERRDASRRRRTASSRSRSTCRTWPTRAARCTSRVGRPFTFASLPRACAKRSARRASASSRSSRRAPRSISAATSSATVWMR